MIHYDLEHARSYYEFDKGITYLNHASHAPLSLPSRAAYNRFFDSWQKTAHNHDPESFLILEKIRGKLAGIIGTTPVRIGLATNTTFGMNVLASGLRWEKGDNLVISERDFPAGIYPWLRLRDRGVEIRFAKTRDGFIDEEALIATSDSQTRLIHTSWVQFNNGNRVDLAKLGDYCSNHDILFSVDGIQGCGVVPIDVPSLKIDLFTSGCQKWLLGPNGTGFYYLSERAENVIEPPFSGWLSVDWHAEFSDLLRYDLKPRQGPAKYETGTYAYQDWWALNAALDIFCSYDQNKIWAHVKSLTERLIAFVRSESKLKLISSTEPMRRTGIVTFSSANSRVLFDKLAANGFVVSYREGAVRVSPHFYNSIEEIDRLIEIVGKST